MRLLKKITDILKTNLCAPKKEFVCFAEMEKGDFRMHTLCLCAQMSQ